MDGKKFLTSAEVMARYQIGRTTLYRWTRDPASGFPAGRKFGTRVLFPLDELEEFERKLPTVRDGAPNAGEAA